MDPHSHTYTDPPPVGGPEIDDPVLDVRDLEIRFVNEKANLLAVQELSYQLNRGRTLGVVGESGCGKTVSALAVLGLLDPPGKISGGEIWFEGRNLRLLTQKQLAKVRGAKIGMVFQEPMTALNPVYTIGDQISEVVVVHQNLSKRAARVRAVELLDLTCVPAPNKRIYDYPHQLSGGLRQRAMIAMALAGEPSLLIADEPTTALDVTLQSQILELFLEIQSQFDMAIQFISHDLGVISEIADEVLVLYAGRAVERAPSAALFSNPRHPYTQGLLSTVPRLDSAHDRLPAIPGQTPNIAQLPSGCPFHDRCFAATTECVEKEPRLEQIETGHWVACLKVGS